MPTFLGPALEQVHAPQEGQLVARYASKLLIPDFLVIDFFKIATSALD